MRRKRWYQTSSPAVALVMSVAMALLILVIIQFGAYGIEHLLGK